MSDGLARIDVAVLAGGLGTRLKGVLGATTPKVLAPIHGRPFLDHLLDWLAGYGARRVVLCLGHLAEQVSAHLAAAPPARLHVTTVIEPQPLGTAGALRLARSALTSDPVLVLNGDTWLDADLAGFADRHRASGALASLLCVTVDDASRYGRVELDDSGHVLRFVEKDPDHAGPGIVSAGVVLISAALLERMDSMPGPSLECDVLQKLPPRSIRADIAPGAFIDIGTPASLDAASGIIPDRAASFY
ncbi:MAG TPA: nucleotidyltransferase family protein [Patescibacteria group bacterium]|nr:nucleotidyltransferase family protein [Patescibacteria group bacterium]